MHYPWAVRYAQVHSACSPETLAQAFRLSPEVARQIMARMQANGVITAPGLSGLARATAPVNWDLQLGRRAVTSARPGLSQRLRRMLTDHAEPAEPVASDTDEDDLETKPEDPSHIQDT